MIKPSYSAMFSNGWISFLASFLSVALVLQTCEAAGIDTRNYGLHTNTLPDDVRFRPPIGNGHIATNVLSDTVYMNGLFNGYEDRSSRARIPAYVSVDVTNENDVSRNFTLDMYYGIFEQKIEKPSCNIVVKYFAHRALSRLLVTSVRINRKSNAHGNITVTLTNTTGNLSDDFNTNVHEAIPGKFGVSNKMYYQGTTKEPEVNSSKPSELYVYYTSLPGEIVLRSDEDSRLFVFVASHSMQQKDALDVFNEALHDTTDLEESHKEAWAGIWREGRIDISGNRDLSQNVIAATYNILCSLPSHEDPVTPFFGLSPGGLSRGGLLVPSMPGGGHNDYAGHVFWDMDTWMMPPITLLHPEMGRRMLSSRTRVLEQVKENAKLAGYQGTKFPWEQATTGIEATPKWAGQMSRFEIHINADISYSLRQYLYANDDVNMVTSQKGFELALEIARFWQSRSNRTDDNTVEILGVMGPDEYHYNIDNSVYTNYNAKLSLLLPQYIVHKFNISLNESLETELRDFDETANDLLILFDEELKYHPQYDTFNLSLQIKQSDVVLLGYPLMMPMSRDVRRNDLELYESITNQEGPDTGTWSMHTVGWLELREEDRAYKSFQMMLRNINEPFKVFSEKPVTNTSTGGCVNFITAAGGLLQSILFGYGGIRLEPNGLVIHPSRLPNTTHFSLVGIHYRSAILNVHYNDSNNMVSIDVNRPEGVRVFITLGNQPSQHAKEISGSDAIVYGNQKARIEVRKGMRTNTKTTPTMSFPESSASLNNVQIPMYFYVLGVVLKLHFLF